METGPLKRKIQNVVFRAGGVATNNTGARAGDGGARKRCRDL